MEVISCTFLNDTVSIYGKLGVAASLLSHDEDNTNFDFWDNESGYGFSVPEIEVGAGVNFAIARSVIMRVAYDSLRINLEDADNTAADTDFDLNYFTLGVYHQF